MDKRDKLFYVSAVSTLLLLIMLATVPVIYGGYVLLAYVTLTTIVIVYCAALKS